MEVSATTAFDSALTDLARRRNPDDDFRDGVEVAHEVTLDVTSGQVTDPTAGTRAPQFDDDLARLRVGFPNDTGAAVGLDDWHLSDHPLLDPVGQ